jgi:hypothetical protein
MPKDAAFVKGHPVSAGLLQSMSNRMRQLSNWRGDDYISTVANDKGTTLAYNQGGGFFAKLTAGSGPYTWTEVQRSGTTWVTSTSGRTGTLNAYEVNGTVVPANRVVKLYQGAQNEYIFRYMREFRPCTGYVCVTVSGCGDYINGATFTLKDHATGTTIGTCTTGGHHGGCCIAITTNGLYDITVSASGYNTKTVTQSCYCGTNSIELTLNPDSITVQYHGCTSAFPTSHGKTATLYKNGTSVATATIDSSSVATFTGLTGFGYPDIYTTSVSCPRYLTTHVYITNSSSGIYFGNVQASVCSYEAMIPYDDTNYICCSCDPPIPKTLNATIDGTSCVLTLISAGYGSGGYTGCITKTVTGIDVTLLSCTTFTPVSSAITSITIPFWIVFNCRNFSGNAALSIYYLCYDGRAYCDGPAETAFYAGWPSNAKDISYPSGNFNQPVCVGPTNPTCQSQPADYSLGWPLFTGCYGGASGLYLPDNGTGHNWIPYQRPNAGAVIAGSGGDSTSRTCAGFSASGTAVNMLNLGYSAEFQSNMPSWNWTVTE